MKIEILKRDQFPPLLKEIPDCPKRLFMRGSSIPEENILIAVVGSRKYSEYGKRATESIIKGLAGYNVSIVSGLALGIDAIAHRSALASDIHTIAIPGSGLDNAHIYPRSHVGLFEKILSSGGTCISEFEPDAKIFPSNFPQRNRIMAGMSQATLVIEAGVKSGTLITARLALEYNRDVFAVPGSIFSSGSVGTNTLIRDGASPVQSAEDLITELHLEKTKDEDTQLESGVSKQDKLLFSGDSIARDEFFKNFSDARTAQVYLSKLELEGKVTVKADIIFKKER